MTDEKNKPEAETSAEPAETLAEELSEEPAAQGEAQDPAQNSAMSGPDIAAIQAENADLRDRLLRAAAEMENTRKRAEREKQDAARYANAGFARDMLEVSDNLRRALATLKADEREAADDSVKAMAEGVEMTERQLAAVL
ncbi:nucleotide exchange factor GrpE, partial [Parvibaculum sp.]